MSILKVARMGHPGLRIPARPVERSEIGTAAIERLIDDMIETMLEYQGVGLAAPQIHQGVRILLAGCEPEGRDETGAQVSVLINPQVTAVGRKVEEDWEGCLSIPDVRGLVPRAVEVRVKAYDRTGAPVELSARGFFARVIQHETDHLDGVLFIDRMKSLQSLTFLDEFAKFHHK